MTAVNSDPLINNSNDDTPKNVSYIFFHNIKSQLLIETLPRHFLLLGVFGVDLENVSLAVIKS